MRLALLLLALSALPLAAAPIGLDTLADVLAIGDAAGVPRSVSYALMMEESGDRRAGILGDPFAISSPSAEGYRSLGLFQIYTEPENLAWLLAQYWHEEDGIFDIFDPFDNATLALRYLAALHRRFGTWYRALVYYNHGSIAGASQKTLDYARRIVEAGAP